MTSKRHGTTTLFAALDVSHSGRSSTSACRMPTGIQEFLRFKTLQDTSAAFPGRFANSGPSHDDSRQLRSPTSTMPSTVRACISMQTPSSRSTSVRPIRSLPALHPCLAQSSSSRFFSERFVRGRQLEAPRRSPEAVDFN